MRNRKEPVQKSPALFVIIKKILFFVCKQRNNYYICSEIKKRKTMYKFVYTRGIMYRYDSEEEIRAAINPELLYNSGASLSYRVYDESGNTTELHIFYFWL